MLNTLNQSWIGHVIGVISIVIAIYIYIRSKREIDLRCYVKGEKLIGGTTQTLPRGTSLAFRNENITCLSKTKVYIWNEGRLPVEGKNVTEKDPLRISIRNGKVLSTTLAYSGRSVNNIQTSQQNSDVFVKFDFLDHMDGMRVEILHDSEILIPNILGTIIGFPKGIKIKLDSRIKEKKLSHFDKMADKLFKYRMAFVAIILSIGVGMVALSIMPYNRFIVILNVVFNVNKIIDSAMLFRMLLAIGGITYIGTSIYGFNKCNVKYPVKLDKTTIKRRKIVMA